MHLVLFNGCAKSLASTVLTKAHKTSNSARWELQDMEEASGMIDNYTKQPKYLKI